MSIIQGHAKSSGVTGFYDFPLEQSLRFNDDDSAYLSWTPDGAGDDSDTWTFSAWVKRGTIGSTQILFAQGPNANDRTFVRFESNDQIRMRRTSGGGGTVDWSINTTQLFRDVSAWYHIVVTYEYSASSSDRVRLYVNGSRVTDFVSTPSYPDATGESDVNTADTAYLGSDVGGGSYFDGYLAEVNCIDGQALTADSFGELKSGSWIPKDPSGLAYGTNGFRLSFADDAEVEAFNTVLYRGNQQDGHGITGMGFQPDLVWLKERDSTSSHQLTDAVRGAGYALYSDSTSAETNFNELVSFDSDGFTVDNSNGANQSGISYVAWGWKAGGSSNTYNIDDTGYATASAAGLDVGTTTPTGASISTTYGFAIIAYTGASSTSTEINHGLGSAPAMIIIKSRDEGTTDYTGQWDVYHKDARLDSDQGYLVLNSNAGQENGPTNVFNAEPTSSSFFIGNAGAVNQSPDNYIAYCWTQKSGLSAFGTYSGNGSSTGPIIYTTDDGTAGGANGFKPAFIIHKKISDSVGTAKSSDWWLQDNTRTVANGNENTLFANGNFAEWTDASGGGFAVDFLDNGFQLKDSNTVFNTSGDIYIYAAFADTREAAFWLDQSGKDNDWQPVNLDHNDTVADSPTNNFCTLTPLNKTDGNVVLSDGNLDADLDQSSGWNSALGTFALDMSAGGKFYWEATANVVSASDKTAIGMIPDKINFIGNTNKSIVDAQDFGDNPKYGITGHGAGVGGYSYAQGDVINVAVDIDNAKVYYGKNGNYFGDMDPSAGTGGTTQTLNTSAGRTAYVPFVAGYGGSEWQLNFGQQPFAHTPPTDYLALSTANLPDPVIDPAQESSPEDYFAGTLYTGNSGSGDNVVDVGFAPDLVWVKSRTQAYPHYLYDKVRGNDLALKSNATDAEATVASFDLTSTGFTLNTTGGSGINEGGQGTNNMMSWNWKAGTSFSNDASATSIGTVDSNGSVSTESGFSIVRFNSGASGTQSFKHGLTQRPDLCIFKEKDSGGSGDHWVVWEGVALNPAQSYGYLNLSNGFANDASQWSNTAPTDSIFTYNSGYAWSTSQEMICYCFHSVEGFSKVGSYTGGGNSLPFIHTGFRPAFIMSKRIDTNGDWHMYDAKRDSSNVVYKAIWANYSSQEYVNYNNVWDFLSNGFKARTTSTITNADGGTYIYMAFAENPFKYSNAR